MSKDKQQQALIRRVHSDLEIGKKYHNPHICYDDLLQIYYLKAECSNKESCIVLPHLSCQEMDLKTINELHSRVGGSSSTM
ncbi:hypothetical protein DOY81_010892 [Sarcophaga bullata]|nr:hypothetical protein DOY81_010892 [Sarcophaga bullata]